MSRLCLLISLTITSLLTLNLGYISYAQNTPKCVNGMDQYTNQYLKGFSFCYDSSVKIVDNIHLATPQEQNTHYQITNIQGLKLSGSIEISSGRSKILIDVKEGVFNALPKRYCISLDIVNSKDVYGSLQTPRGGYIDLQPTIVNKYLNSYSQEYNGLLDKDNNILNSKDPYIKSPLEAAKIFDPKLNTYVNSDVKFKDQYPFTLSLMGHLLPYQSPKDQRIISNLMISNSAYDITNQNISSNFESLATSNNKPILQDFQSGNGRCFDNNHRLYGVPINTNTMLNPIHSSGYQVNPELDDKYSEVVTMDSAESKLSNSTSNITLKLFSSTNLISPLISTIESICWNNITCKDRDLLILRPANNINMVPSNSLSRDAQDLLELKSQEGLKTQTDKINNSNDPYYNQSVILNYTVHCDSKSELTSSEIPSPILKSLTQSRSNANEFQLSIQSIYKQFPLKIRTYTNECNNLDIFGFKIQLPIVKTTHYQLHDIPKGIDQIQTHLYKNSIQLQDEVISSNWIETKDKSTITQTISNRNTTFSIPNPSFDQSQVTSTDELYSRSRIYGNFNLTNLTSKPNQDISFKYEDLRSKLPLGINNPIGSYLNESEKSNLMKLDASTSNIFTPDSVNQIDATMWVKGDRSDRVRKNDIRGYYSIIKDSFTDNPIFGGQAKETLESTKIVDESIPFGFKLLNRGVDRKVYNKKSNLWIISHGYKDNFGGEFEKMGDQIINDHPGDIVLGLDWSNISDKGANSVDSLSYDICRVPTWIRPISQVIYQRLKAWGFEDPTKLNMIGHSLGTLMSSEIAQRFIEVNKGKPNKMILLDPPSETRCKLRFNQYTVQSIPSIPKVQSFQARANYTYSFVGNHSLAGNEQMAITAHRSYWMDFGNWNDLGKEHTAVVSTFEKINRSDRLADKNNKPEGYLSTLDQDNHDDFESKKDGSKPVPKTCELTPIIGCQLLALTQTPDNEQWKEANWEGHYGVLEAGQTTDLKDGGVERLWVKQRNFVNKINK